MDTISFWQVKQPNMATHCPCGGYFKNMEKDYGSRLEVFSKIGSLFNMPQLKELSEWMIASQF